MSHKTSHSVIERELMVFDQIQVCWKLEQIFLEYCAPAEKLEHTTASLFITIEMATHYLRLQSQYRDVDEQSTRNHDTF